MKTVSLYTRTCEFVAKVEVPPMHPMPEGIMWGDRFFIRKDSDVDADTYYEGMVWLSTDPKRP